MSDDVDSLSVSAAALADAAERQLRAVETEIEELHQRLAELKPERARLSALARAGRRRPVEDDSVGSRVMQFAAQNGGAFTFQEAVGALGATSNSVGSTLSRLVNTGQLTRAGRAEYRLPDDEG